MGDISRLMAGLAGKEGVNPTNIHGVNIFKASQYQAPEPLCYQQGVIIAGQGRKRVFVDNHCFEYNPDNYLVLGVPLPARCETFAAKEAPFMALVVDFNPHILGRILERMEHYPGHDFDGFKSSQLGVFTARSSRETKETVLRLLRVLQSPMESRVLGEYMVNELIFRVLCGENAAILYGLCVKNTKLARIEKALSLIHQDFTRSLNIDELSSSVNMSQSGFHRTFKRVTGSSPIQYVKKLRLDRARDMLLGREVRVNEAASLVGYTSATQFSREFKRHFGKSPAIYVEARRMSTEESP